MACRGQAGLKYRGMTGSIVILGASGRIGRMLYRLWQTGALDLGEAPLWQVRRPAEGQAQALIWDILHQDPPAIAPSGVICLAGGPGVAENAALSAAAMTFARGAPLLFASTQAVYGPQQGALREGDACRPAGAYGATKLAAEQVLAAHPAATCLRIGNVVGADMLSRAIQAGPVTLDRFPDGQGPRRMMIGPRALGQAMIDLLAMPQTPRVLNLAQPGLVAMADMLEAAGANWRWQPAPETALPVLEMDLSLAQSLIDLPPADPAAMLAEARAAGREPQA